MTPLEVIERCFDLGVELELDGDGLVVRGDGGALTHVVDDLRRHKPALLRILRAAANEQPAPEPATLYDLIWRASDLGVRLEVVNSVLMVSGPEAAIEPLDRLLWDNRDELVRALSPYREGDPLEDPRSVQLVKATTRGEVP